MILLLAVLLALIPVLAQDNELVGEIVFSSEGNLYTIDLSTNVQIQLTDDGISTYPRWSPDGQKIAYIAGGDIYMMASDGTDKTRLTNAGHVVQYPVWSPDSDKMACLWAEGEGKWGVNLVSTSAQEPELNLFEQQTDWAVIWGVIYRDRTPVWSPDGEALLLDIGCPDVAPLCNRIYLINVNKGKSIPILTEYPYLSSPSWSPTRNEIMYVSTAEGENFGIFVSGIDGNNRHRVGKFIEISGNPAWSPDGMMIAYSAGMNWYFSICLALVDSGKSLGCFNEGHSIYEYPIWSPDSRYVLFRHYGYVPDDDPGDYVLSGELKVLDVDTGKICPLAVTTDGFMMDWRPQPVMKAN